MSKAIASLVKQTTKAAAAKPVAKKAAPVKAAAKKASAQPKMAQPASFAFKHSIITGRPGSGASLYAFTAAWFELAGLDQGKAIARKDAEFVAGKTAIAYHIREGRMIEREGKVSVTAGGMVHFAARKDKIDSDAKKAWMSILTTGKADGKLIKNQDCIRTI